MKKDSKVEYEVEKRGIITELGEILAQVYACKEVLRRIVSPGDDESYEGVDEKSSLIEKVYYWLGVMKIEVSDILKLAKEIEFLLSKAADEKLEK